MVENELILTIPNVFTPNFDGDNDNFVIGVVGAGLLKSLKAEVFNRWGEKVVDQIIAPESNTNQIVLWDGYTNAAAISPTGTYYYVISYETIDSESNTEKGSVTLLR